jgi:hypothetical protein
MKARMTPKTPKIMVRVGIDDEVELERGTVE